MKESESPVSGICWLLKDFAAGHEKPGAPQETGRTLGRRTDQSFIELNKHFTIFFANLGKVCGFLPWSIQSDSKKLKD